MTPECNTSAVMAIDLDAVFKEYAYSLLDVIVCSLVGGEMRLYIVYRSNYTLEESVFIVTVVTAAFYGLFIFLQFSNRYNSWSCCITVGFPTKNDKCYVRIYSSDTKHLFSTRQRIIFKSYL